MTFDLRRSRQPFHNPWLLDRLVHERAIALGHALDQSTQDTYSSALNSYLTFCCSHNFPIEPTPDTFSFYAVYMSSFIKPDFVDSYLSGICSNLEPYFPSVRQIRKCPLVSRTLHGCMCLRGSSIHRKRALTTSDIQFAIAQSPTTPSHDDHLFLAQLLTGFHALLRLGELVWPDSVSDPFFHGSQVLIINHLHTADPRLFFQSYLVSRDTLFPLQPELWLRENGAVPTRTWFIRRLQTLFPNDVAGHSLRSGGATALAEIGMTPALIQASGRWSSDTFQAYICKHPTLLAALLFARNAPHASTIAP
ncbi:uncharacterized protein FIBRA_08219 [Fibroporia radiculosa]|uniref:Tyr recombinase domain-containing protein n=1 Tax=Fibroporia radiculosa TaxID=599839 RepID=J4GGU9_9APHY|nr:uncharacterized protein FIBRA_08219 [Fibroporia radiculosa]CCM05978.1 predicted protein [Fibroporia radiculosa]